MSGKNFMLGVFNKFNNPLQSTTLRRMNFTGLQRSQNNYGIGTNQYWNNSSSSIDLNQYWANLENYMGDTGSKTGEKTDAMEANGKAFGYSEKTHVSTKEGANGTITTISSTVNKDWPSVSNEISVSNYTHVKQVVEDLNNQLTPIVAEALEIRESGQASGPRLEELKKQARAIIDYIRDVQKIQEQIMNELKSEGKISADEKITEYSFNVFPNWEQGIFDIAETQTPSQDIDKTEETEKMKKDEE